MHTIVVPGAVCILIITYSKTLHSSSSWHAETKSMIHDLFIQWFRLSWNKNYTSASSSLSKNDHFVRPHRLRMLHTISHKSTSKASPPSEASGSLGEIMEVNMKRWSITEPEDTTLIALCYNISPNKSIWHRFEMHVAITIMTSLHQFFLRWAVVTHCTLVNAGWWSALSFHLSEKHHTTQDVC